ncbi:Oxoglutarate/iron-dependent dioxygenase [Penicillium capsulatum]|uniref:Oxoglutarate/iron-dependent dioxygenase n=1 Tax=Penicillium capsulatum TaxID=69766 RepID=A0A9W9LWJ1_9EURO|nr:Oxoglutarate/iron-dependent dioxygenase [Penicillium capsulatum]KAJ6122854.1 Oxoglutarate/iron-dependent dioxygenase [Penicillium capsulatum]
MAAGLDAARIVALPHDAFYISNFISEEEEVWLLQKVASAPLPRWTQLSHRRLQTWPSALTANNTLIAEPLPEWLVSPIIKPRFGRLGIFNNAPDQAPNHVLVNEYLPGQGIMPHEDGAAYHPLVATVSLGAPIVLDIYEKNIHDATSVQDVGTNDRNKPRFRILQERRSLLITTGAMYTDFLHGIAETTRDENINQTGICNWDLLREKECFREGYYQRETRVSLTYRDVLKVAKMGNTMKFLGGRR